MIAMRLGQAVDLGGEQRVLVVHALREPDARAGPGSRAGRSCWWTAGRRTASGCRGRRGRRPGAANSSLAQGDSLPLVRFTRTTRPATTSAPVRSAATQQVLAGVPLVDVVAVEEHHVRRAGALHAGVARPAAAAAVLRQPHDGDPRVLAGQLLGDLGRAVGGASSTTMTSRLRSVWSSTERIACGRLARSLYPMTTTDTSGAGLGRQRSVGALFDLSLSYGAARPAAATESTSAACAEPGQTTGGRPARVRRHTVRQRIGRRSPAPGPEALAEPGEPHPQQPRRAEPQRPSARSRSPGRRRPAATAGCVGPPTPGSAR